MDAIVIQDYMDTPRLGIVAYQPIQQIQEQITRLARAFYPKNGPGTGASRRQLVQPASKLSSGGPLLERANAAAILPRVSGMPPTLKYESGLVGADGDYGILHGRFSGFGLPVNWIAADTLIRRLPVGVVSSLSRQVVRREQKSSGEHGQQLAPWSRTIRSLGIGLLLVIG